MASKFSISFLRGLHSSRLLLIFALFFASPVCYAAAFNVKDYGAKGDGTTLDTGAINATIDASFAAGGGTVDFPAGQYLSYTIRLKSNVTLHLDAGATLLAADPPADLKDGYDAPEPNPGNDQWQDFGHSHWRNSLIWGENLENVSITGQGLIFGRGLSMGVGLKDPLPAQQKWPRAYGSSTPQVSEKITPGPFGIPNANDALPAGTANKAIALKNCRNVTLRDFSIFHGGHFAILATGVDNLTVDNLKIDSNRDGMDIDCCSNVRITNCSVNTPIDDAICLKATYALGELRPTENVTISNCFVSGFDEGSLLSGKRTRGPSNGGPYGRIKFGTEATSGFRNISIANCVFEYCRGLALEQVDGAMLEDISISNITMRDIVNAPIFIRLASRLRGPNKPSMGVARRIKISNLVASNVSRDHGIFIAGVPGGRIEDVSLSDIRILYRGGGTQKQAERVVPELEKGYPEPSAFGVLPSWGIFARHVTGLNVRDVDLRTQQDDQRPVVWLQNVITARFNGLQSMPTQGTAIFALDNVVGLTIRDCEGVADASRIDAAQSKQIFPSPKPQ